MYNSDLVKKYFTKKIDVDNSIYLSMNDDVEIYDKFHLGINKIIEKIRQKIDFQHSLFIKGNYLCFTLNNTKYWTKISCFLDEEKYISCISMYLESIGCTDVLYKFGVLD